MRLVAMLWQMAERESIGQSAAELARLDAVDEVKRRLEPKLPMEYRPAINRLLLPFGKYICTGGTPRCLSCPLIDLCPKIGVTKARK